MGTNVSPKCSNYGKVDSSQRFFRGVLCAAAASQELIYFNDLREARPGAAVLGAGGGRLSLHD
jgi:hypothetical protein